MKKKKKYWTKSIANVMVSDPGVIWDYNFWLVFFNETYFYKLFTFLYTLTITKKNLFLSGNLLASRKDYWFFSKNSALNLGTFFITKIHLFTI